MENFLSYKNKKRVFVGLEFSDESRQELQGWCRASGFDLSKSYSGKNIDQFDFHITVFYTSNEVRIPNGIFPIPSVEITPYAFELFGEKKNIPVLRISQSSQLLSIYNYFKSQGLQSSWPDWKIHVSLSYQYNGIPNLENLALPPFKLNVNKIKIEEVDE